MGKQNRSYTAECRQEAISLAMSSPSVTSAARNIGVPEATLHTWTQKAKSSGMHSIPTEDGSVSQVDVGKVIDENKWLKKRLARLEQEKSILKKAAQYFAAELQ